MLISLNSFEGHTSWLNWNPDLNRLNTKIRPFVAIVSRVPSGWFATVRSRPFACDRSLERILTLHTSYRVFTCLINVYEFFSFFLFFFYKDSLIWTLNFCLLEVSSFNEFRELVWKFFVQIWWSNLACTKWRMFNSESELNELNGFTGKDERFRSTNGRSWRLDASPFLLSLLFLPQRQGSSTIIKPLLLVDFIQFSIRFMRDSLCIAPRIPLR